MKERRKRVIKEGMEKIKNQLNIIENEIETIKMPIFDQFKD